MQRAPIFRWRPPATWTDEEIRQQVGELVAHEHAIGYTVGETNYDEEPAHPRRRAYAEDIGRELLRRGERNRFRRVVAHRIDKASPGVNCPLEDLARVWRVQADWWIRWLEDHGVGAIDTESNTYEKLYAKRWDPVMGSLVLPVPYGQIRGSRVVWRGLVVDVSERTLDTSIEKIERACYVHRTDLASIPCKSWAFETAYQPGPGLVQRAHALRGLSIETRPALWPWPPAWAPGVWSDWWNEIARRLLARGIGLLTGNEPDFDALAAEDVVRGCWRTVAVNG